MGVPYKIDGVQWKILLTWMIWRYPPFQEPPKWGIIGYHYNLIITYDPLIKCDSAPSMTCVNLVFQSITSMSFWEKDGNNGCGSVSNTIYPHLPTGCPGE